MEILIKEEIMDIQKYTTFFHDGSILNILCKNSDIEISMESSEILPEWNIDNIHLSKQRTIKGKLKLEGIKNILINDCSVSKLNMIDDDAEILRFRIYENKVDLLIKWMHCSLKDQHSCDLIKIEASRIYWENIPDLVAA